MQGCVQQLANSDAQPSPPHPALQRLEPLPITPAGSLPGYPPVFPPPKVSNGSPLAYTGMRQRKGGGGTDYAVVRLESGQYKGSYWMVPFSGLGACPGQNRECWLEFESVSPWCGLHQATPTPAQIPGRPYHASSQRQGLRCFMLGSPQLTNTTACLQGARRRARPA